jgi:hypothetical protein
MTRQESLGRIALGANESQNGECREACVKADRQLTSLPVHRLRYKQMA